MPPPYSRQPERVIPNLQTRADGGVYTKVPCKIQVPERYLERHLASIAAEIYILGFFAIIMEDSYYSVSQTAAMMRITPSSTERVDIDGTRYLEFHFDQGERVFYTTDLVKNDVLMFYIYDEHIAKGRIPWYFTYFDLASLFDTAELHAGIKLGNRAVLDMITMTIARNSDDMTQLYRHVLTKPSDIHSNPPTIVPFRSVIWNTADTTSKLIGSHFGDSITSALVNPSERVERIEELLRT
jgi:hypothetical protein